MFSGCRICILFARWFAAMNQPLQCSGKRFGLRAIDRFSAGGAGKQIGKLRGQVAGFAQPQQAADGQLLPLQTAPALAAFGEIVFGDAAQRFQAAYAPCGQSSATRF